MPSLKQPGLLRGAGTALPALALSSIWASLGFTFIVMTAALQSIPRELYESAFVDGAGGWMRFTNVTLPMLGPTILFTSVVLTTRAYQSYAEPALLTQGGPDPQRPTETMAYLIYGQTSLVKNDIGLKSTAAVLLFVVLLVLAFVQFRGLDKRVHYGS
jgi:ABC-type sugar transport system permease subunit